MTSASSKPSLRLALLGGACLSAVVATPALAATIGPITITSVATSSLNVCAIRASYSVTGVTNDSSGFDIYYMGHVTGTGVRFNALANRSVAVGANPTISGSTSEIPISSTLRTDYYYIIYETDINGAQGAELGRALIPRSMLAAGGTACSRLMVNAAPVNSAGPDQALGGGGGTVNLSGTASDGDGDPLTHTWTQVSGPTVTLTGANTLNPSFTAPAQTNQARTMVFRLTTSDGIASPVTDDIAVTIPAGPNTLPTANAGNDRTIGGGPQASLLGSGTDLDGDPLTYSWTQVSGTPVTFVTPTNTANAIFNSPASNGVAQPLVFQLIVNDGFGNSAPDQVTLTVPANIPPTVSAGPDATYTGSSAVTLAGSATDSENNPLTYQWTQTAGTPVTLTGATTLTPSFTAPPKAAGPQVLTFSLTANDGTSTSTPDTVDITIPGNAQPLPSAGADQTVSGGQTVTLTAAGSSDPDGDALTYVWTQVAGPTVTLTGANTRNPTFVAPPGGSGNQTLTFRVEVFDPLTTGDPPADLVDIVVLPNAPPVANAGPDQGPINTGSTVTLNGGGSTDPDGNPLTYTWTQVSGPTVTLTNPTSATPTFVAPNVNGTQNLVFQLVVNDGSVNSQPDTVTIAVRAVGTITVIQRVQGADGTFSYTSDVTALTGTIVTANGIGQRVATLVPAGSHTVTAADARAAGYALISIACNDSDSVVNLANRNVAIALSPNESLVCTFTSANTRDAALVAIQNFLTARNAALLANRPDLQRRLDRLGGVTPTGGSASISGLPIPGSGHLPISFNMTNGRAHATTSLGMLNAAGKGGRPSKPFDIWAEAYFASLDYDRHQGEFRVIYTGADYRISPDLLVGVLAQFDDFKIKGARIAGSADGHGWMAGPYMTAKLAPHLYVDARAAWGKSDNTVSPLGTYVDTFKTNRSLYSGSLIGQFDLGSAAQFRPEVTVRYLEERQQGYVDFYGVTIPSQTVGQGDISFRPRLHYTTSVGNGWALRPYAEAEGIYTFGLDRQNVLTESLRMRIEGGADLFSAGGLRFGLSGFHDGIGSDGFKSTGAHISVSFGF
jgi:chitinase